MIGGARTSSSTTWRCPRGVEHGHLHAKPSEVGRLARDARCGLLLLTHFMPEIEEEPDEAVAGVSAAPTPANCSWRRISRPW